MAELSVIIAGRNEQFMARTIDSCVKAIRGDTEVIAIADGGWPEPPIADHPAVQLVCRPQSIGQRGAVNEGVRISRAKFVMKADAHCAFDEGFDVKLMQPYKDGEIDLRTTTVPRMYNLHAFDHLCKGCGRRIYQGAKPAKCENCGGVDIVQDIVWQPRQTKVTDYARFDSELHFQYFGEYKHRQGRMQEELSDLMCCVGAGWMMPKSFYEEIEGMDEGHGSWGQMGVELACKSWLCGGRQIVNKRTWFAHMFRTQPGFGFPYPISGGDVDRARKHSRKLWMENTWRKQVKPLSWLVQKFMPVPSWDDEKIAACSRMNGKQVRIEILPPAKPSPAASAAPARVEVSGIRLTPPKVVKRGILYYTHNEGDPAILTAVQRQLDVCAKLHRIDRVVSVSLRPIDFGDNIVLPFQKGILTMFKQQLRGLEALNDVDVVFFAEHDVLYHPDHFAFDPPRPDVFYYDENVWKIDASDKQPPLFYFAKQTAQLCGSRDLLLGHYQRRVAKVEADGSYSRHMGYEPGCHMPPRGVDAYPAMRWMAPSPQLDIRHGSNLTANRWDQSQFRNKDSCLGWTLSEDVPAWPRIFGRFATFIRDVATGGA